MAAAAAEPHGLSIIVPALNEAGIIEATLVQLQPFRARGQEVILVDGGSSDATVSLARPLVDRVLHSPPGRALQMHRGAGEASGEVLWFLHADSRVPATADAEILQALRPGTAGWGRFDISLKDDQLALRCIAWCMNQRSRLTGIATGDQGIFVSRRLYETAGGFPQIPLMEDIRFSRTLGRYTQPRCLNNTRLGSSPRRWQTHGIARTILTMWSLRLAHFAGVSPQRLVKFYAACNG